jgi:FtsP/CotA-like multicopper oxidase with cupredoxin domain
VRGLYTRPASGDEALEIPASSTRQVTFLAGAPGTYLYWGTSTQTPINERVLMDSQLSGAIVVVPRGEANNDRTFVLGVYANELTFSGRERVEPRELFVINGKSWPHTERFTFNQGDTISWRWINASAAPHPMHLHGFYFTVDRRGTIGADLPLPKSASSQQNTQVLTQGTTMAIHFVPSRPGNWLFHCHLAAHVDADATLRNVMNVRPVADMRAEHANMHGVHEMAGLILGIHVLPRGPQLPASTLAPQNLRLLVQTSAHGYNRNPAIGFALQRGTEPLRDSVELPGPTLLLEKGRPARITVVNRLKVATAIHWHGMELTSFPDGVPGWSGTPGRIMPAIQPADSFVAEFTPPRAGTFIYHSHMNELVQTNSGMYGALIVTDSTHRFDPRINKLILVGGGGPGSIGSRSPGMVNGTAVPQMELEAGTTYRLHIVQIHPQAVVVFRLGSDSTTARWTPVAKDGADLPAEQATERAASVVMGAGETGEFLYTPDRPGLLRLVMYTRGPGWTVPLVITVRAAAKAVAGP